MLKTLPISSYWGAVYTLMFGVLYLIREASPSFFYLLFGRTRKKCRVEYLSYGNYGIPIIGQLCIEMHTDYLWHLRVDTKKLFGKIILQIIVCSERVRKIFTAIGSKKIYCAFMENNKRDCHYINENLLILLT